MDIGQQRSILKTIMRIVDFGFTLGFEKGDKLFDSERDVHFYFCQEVHRLHFSKWGSDRFNVSLIENRVFTSYRIFAVISVPRRFAFNIFKNLFFVIHRPVIGCLHLGFLFPSKRPLFSLTIGQNQKILSTWKNKQVCSQSTQLGHSPIS